jgi:hypothetical protein
MEFQSENQVIIPALLTSFKVLFGKSASEADIIAGQAKRRFLALRDFGNLDDEALDITLNKLASRVPGKVWARA